MKTAKQITETYRARFHDSWEYYHLKVDYDIVKNEETGETEYNQTGYSEGYVNFSESYYSTETIVRKAAEIAATNKQKISNYGSAPDDYDLPSFTRTNRTAREYQKTIASKTFSTGKVTENVTTTPITSQLMAKLNKCGGTETLNDMARSIKTLQKKFGLPQTGTMNGMVAKQLSNLGKGTLSKGTGGTNAISPTVFAGLGITIAPPISAGFEGSTSAVLTEIIGTTIGAAKIATPVGVFFYILLKPTVVGVPEDVERVRIQAHINEAANDTVGDSKIKGKIGENGTKTPSETVGQNGKTERVDIENPNPGQRDGQIHYHDQNNKKYIYDIAKKVLVDVKTGEVAVKSVQKVLNDPWVKKAIEKGLKYLGE